MAFHRTLLPVAASLVAAFALGCSSTLVEPDQYSGFLSSYDALEEVKADDGAEILRWISPQLAAGHYTQVMVDPVIYYPAPVTNAQIPSETLAEVRADFDTAVRRELEARHLLANAPGQGVLRIRPAITGVKVPVRSLAFYEYVPIALVFAGVTTAIGERGRVVQVFLEAEVIDSLSGERIAEVVRKGQAKGPENEKAKLTLDNVKPVIDDWAKVAAETVARMLKQP